ncbi:hypothetical protein BHE74_00030966 [Ensete ventricosum]|nr:hypothetical protein BHE74_00030966 [Ensete ventricosum]
MTLNSMTPFAWSRLAVVAPPLLSAPSSPSFISVGSVSNTLRGEGDWLDFSLYTRQVVSFGEIHHRSNWDLGQPLEGPYGVDRFREAVLFEWAGSIWKDPD